MEILLSFFVIVVGIIVGFVFFGIVIGFVILGGKFLEGVVC